MTMTTIVKEKRKEKIFLLQKVRIVTILLPILYSIWLAISNARALNHRENDRNEIIATVFVRTSFAPKDSRRQNITIPNDGSAELLPSKVACISTRMLGYVVLASAMPIIRLEWTSRWGKT
jgi:hypothetical protein